MLFLQANKIIKVPEVRVLLDEIINYPVVNRKTGGLLEIDTDERALFGYAFEVLYDFYMHRNDTSSSLIQRYSKPLSTFVLKCEKNQGKKKEELYLFDNRNFLCWNAIGDFKTAVKNSNQYKTLRLADVQNKYEDSLDIISKNIGLTNPSDELYEAVCDIAKIYPSLKRFTISIRHLGQPNDYLRLSVKIAFLELINNFPKTPQLVIKEPKINFCHVHCRPDFIIDNALVEIKCTRELLVKEHIRQIVFYYIALTQQKTIKTSKITTITIYYPRHDVVYEVEIHNLINLKKLESSIHKLKEVLEDYHDNI